MSDKEKGFSFKQLFFRETPANPQDSGTQVSPPSTDKTTDTYVSASISGTPSGSDDQSLVADFVQRLQNLINQNDQPGFDFLEFTDSLFEEKQNPTPEVYKTVYRIAQKIDKSLTPARLLDSARFYKDLVQKAADTEMSKGETKKQGLQADKETERTNLDNNLKDTRTKIQQLTKQIQDLQNQEVNLNGQLLAIDQKYSSQFTDIDRKINAIRSAKEQVLVSIVDIEAGIKTNLS